MFRAIDKWLAGYLGSVMRRPGNVSEPKHLIFCIADHFEPFQDNAEKASALWKVENWLGRLPAMAGSFRDADGVRPRYTFFYPQEEYDTDCLNKMAELCRSGFGEVEIQLHHRNDSPAGFKSKLEEFRDVLRKKHGLLGEWKTRPDGAGLLQAEGGGHVAFGFVHGNWALCNSRPDGDWCGVNEELGVLRSTGCYADFTFPSAPSSTQPRMVNSIYYSSDTGHPRACDRGERVRVCGSLGVRGSGSVGRQENTHTPIRPNSDASLMLITGPLAMDWQRRKWGLLPRLENGAITAANPPSPERSDLWVRQYIHIEGRPEWVFVKVHTHGCRPENMDVVLGEPMRRAFDYLTTAYNDERKWILHFATAREMYNIVRAAEDGKTGNPGEYRDYEISRPPAAGK